MTVDIQTTTRAVPDEQLFAGRGLVMLGGQAAAPVVGGPRLIAIDVGGDTIALDVAEIVGYSPSPFSDELTIGTRRRTTDQADRGVTGGQRRGPGRRKKGGS